jgi:hypothetical protein
MVQILFACVDNHTRARTHALTSATDRLCRRGRGIVNRCR